jgi:PST family polysaccharide transporter
MQHSSLDLADTTETHSAEPLRYRTARAALTTGGSEVVTRVLSVVLSIVTARMLEPREVGLLGIGVILVGVISMLSSFPVTAGFTAQSADTDSSHALSAFFIRFCVTVAFLTGLFLSISRTGRYLGIDSGGLEEFRQLLLIMAWLPVLELFSSYPQVLLQRKLDLNCYAWIGSIQPIILVAVAIALLLLGYGYRGVAWANVVATASTSALIWLRLWFRGWLAWGGWPSLANWRATIVTSAKLFIGGVGGYLGERVDNLLVAGALGPAAMSFYSMAWNASRTPANVFARAINFVLVPTLARLRDEPERVRRALTECLRHSYLLLAPACAVLFVSAPLLVSYVIGAKWLPLVPALRVMCFTALAIPLLFASGAILVAAGRAHLTAVATGIHLVVLVVAVPTLSRRWGVTGAAYAELLSVVALTATLVLTARLETRQFGRYSLAESMLPIFAAMVAAGATQAIGSFPSIDYLRLAFQVAFVLIAYTTVLIVLGGRARLMELIRLLSGLFRPNLVVTDTAI